MSVSRHKIIDEIERCLKDNPLVYAMWFEGADATDTVDEYSDLDVVVDVKDGAEEQAFGEVESALARLGRIDLSHEKEPFHPKLRHRVLHLQETPGTLLIDLVVQSHSREDGDFIRQNRSEQPKVIFDKAEVIKFRDVDETRLADDMRERLTHLRGVFAQQSRVTKYVARRKFLECVGYYSKFVLKPLIEVLRIRYSPLCHDYDIVHISEHLPEQVVSEFEDMFKVNTVEQIAEKTRRDETSFSVICGYP